MMGLRADITRRWRASTRTAQPQGVTRLCYCGSVLHTRRQAGRDARADPDGAELYGDAGSKPTSRSCGCCATPAARPRAQRAHRHRHVAIFRSIAKQLGPQLEAGLFEALQKKDVPALRELTKKCASKTRDALLLLPELYGGSEVLAWRRRAAQIAELARSLATLRKLARACKLPVSFDLAELRGYHYIPAWCWTLIAMA